MAKMASLADKLAIENEMPWEARQPARTLRELLDKTAARVPDRPAFSFQLFSDPGAAAETLDWRLTREKVVRTANLFRSLGIGEKDVVAYILPTINETAIVFMAGAIAGIVNPINPLLEPKQMAALLRESGAKVVVTLRSFPKSDVAQRAAEAVAMAPDVETVIEVDLLRYLTGLKKLIVPLLRPRNPVRHKARVLDFDRAIAGQPGDDYTFPDTSEDRIAAYFHTGGTTGMPKLAQHRYSGMIYNGWCVNELIASEEDTFLCPLPLFHVFAAYPILMAVLASGAHMVMPTPAGYRGEGVFDNFWKLVERWQATFMVTVPTAVAQLMQRPVDADVSSLKTALCGSAPLPVELFRRFEEATGVTILEGYGMTEATCLISANPYDGEKKIGSVGLPFPYTDVRILDCDGAGNIRREAGVDEVAEICVFNPGVIPGATYTDPEKNRGLFAEGRWLRTGDLGRIDGDGYLWITGRAKDLIIRGGHNIDPAIIEEALASHPEVAFVGAIGQPDAHSGELPAAYVELVEGGTATVEELMEHARRTITERAAVPKYLEILDELPKTAVGKVFKPALRKMAITRVYNAALAEAGVPAVVVRVVEDKKRGLVACLEPEGEKPSDEEVNKVLGRFPRPWEWAG